MRKLGASGIGGVAVVGFLACERSGGEEDAETQTCELAKGLYVTPVFSAAPIACFAAGGGS